ncbi:MAG: hypothetical protein ACRDOS_02465 [Gaiellaceae bacterium]
MVVWYSPSLPAEDVEALKTWIQKDDKAVVGAPDPEQTVPIRPSPPAASSPVRSSKSRPSQPSATRGSTASTSTPAERPRSPAGPGYSSPFRSSS